MPTYHARPPLSPPPKRPSGAPYLFAAVLLLLLAIGLLAYFQFRKYQQNKVSEVLTSATSPASTHSDPVSPDRIIFGGYPRPGPTAGPESQFTLLENKAYAVGYSEARKDPLWVAYRVFHNPNPFHLPRPKSGFQEDDRTLAKIKSSDYTSSGYDRGHLAPNSAIAACYGPDAQLQTFLMSNICPQTPFLNERVWEKLEQLEKSYAEQLDEVWIIDGPIFADLNGGKTPKLKSGVHIPDAFYKIVIDQSAPKGRRGGPPRLFAVIMPQNVNGTELPQQFTTSVRTIESKTHLNFLPTLPQPDQDTLETPTFPLWPE